MRLFESVTTGVGVIIFRRQHVTHHYTHYTLSKKRTNKCRPPPEFRCGQEHGGDDDANKGEKRSMKCS